MAAPIDVEDETVLSVVFKDQFPDSWKENPDFSQYLSELSSFGIDRLARESDRLAEERAQILEETQDLAFHNYKTFIQTAECSAEIFQDFQIIEQNVGSLLEKLPEFSEKCKTFLSKAQEISSDRRLNSLILQRHTQLLEVLEMPQLMDTCVRNGYYDEALELASHVKRLEQKHAAIPIIANIVTEIKKSTDFMLNQLIDQLRSNIQLPACLKVIGYLRRMDVFTEAEMRLKFLHTRDSWFQSILNTIPKSDAYNHITKTIELSRVHLFDIITQYRAIFSDEDPLLSTLKTDSEINEKALFHSWVIEKVSHFLTTLEADLRQGLGGRLDSVLGQCMYFGLSFSRVGADFRGLLVPVFQTASLAAFETSVTEATQRFEEFMQTYTLMSTSTPMFSSSAFNVAGQVGQLHPPMNLVEYQPLAVYCNNILTSFNELRLCAPIAIAGDVTNVLQQSLKRVVTVILSFHRTEEGAFNEAERANFVMFCRGFAEDLVPYLNKCLQTLYPPSQLAKLMGISVAALIKMGASIIDTQNVLADMEHILPRPEIEPEQSMGDINKKDPTHDAGQESTSLVDAPEKPEKDIVVDAVSSEHAQDPPVAGNETDVFAETENVSFSLGDNDEQVDGSL